jgi:hypothetical protein
MTNNKLTAAKIASHRYLFCALLGRPCNKISKQGTKNKHFYSLEPLAELVDDESGIGLLVELEGAGSVLRTSRGAESGGCRCAGGGGAVSIAKTGRDGCEEP